VLNKYAFLKLDKLFEKKVGACLVSWGFGGKKHNQHIKKRMTQEV
jgi:hypothetical protein